jgi:hypothetical protein
MSSRWGKRCAPPIPSRYLDHLSMSKTNVRYVLHWKPCMVGRRGWVASRGPGACRSRPKTHGTRAASDASHSARPRGAAGGARRRCPSAAAFALVSHSAQRAAGVGTGSIRNCVPGCRGSVHHCARPPSTRVTTRATCVEFECRTSRCQAYRSAHSFPHAHWTR